MQAGLLRLLPRKADYDLSAFRHDLLAGITVAIVALPLALGFGITSGAGAAAGLYTSIVAGVLAAVFGTNLQVSGPSGTMTVVLIPLIARFGIEALVPLGILAGLILLVFAFSRVGQLIRYIPYPVITGFTSGVAAIIFLQQLPGFLGAPQGDHEQVVVSSWQTLRSFVAAPGLATPLLGVVTILIMVAWGRSRRLRSFPASMAALLGATALSFLPIFDTVGRIPDIPTGLPTPAMPTLAGMPMSDLVRAAFVIAVLAALESLLSAVVVDGMTIDERHDPDRELFGQGIANIGAGIVGGLPATAALARTAVNVRSGARTRLAAIIHGVLLAGIVLVLAPLVSRIPLVVLAGILMVVAYRMVERTAIREILRATKSDAATMLVTLFVTVAFDLILAIELGLLLAGVAFITRMSRLLHVDPTMLGRKPSANDKGTSDGQGKEPIREDELIVFRVDGPLFFGAADRFFEELLRVDRRIKVVILRLRQVPVMDVTGASALRSLIDRLKRRGIMVMLSGVQPQPLGVLQRTGILDAITRDGDHLFDDTQDAIAHAHVHLANQDHTHPAIDDQTTAPPGGPNAGPNHSPDTTPSDSISASDATPTNTAAVDVSSPAR